MESFESSLKRKVKRGEIAIFDVYNAESGESRVEYLDGVEIRDLLAEPNSERLSDLLAIYDGYGADVDEERYRLIAGAPLISYLIQETAIFIRESVLETPEADEQRVEEFLTERKEGENR